MTINLPEKLERSIRKAVHEGQFATVDDAIAEAWQLLVGQRQQEQSGKPMTPDELHQQMLADGLLSELPNSAEDIEDEDEAPITIEGEPLSETIIRERR